MILQTLWMLATVWAWWAPNWEAIFGTWLYLPAILLLSLDTAALLLHCFKILVREDS